MKREKIIFGGIMLASLVLRCMRIHSRGIQYDDAFSVFLAERSIPEIIKGTSADTMPPLYYFLLHFWMLISQQLWFIRVLSILFSIGSALILYEMIKKMVDPKSALWATALMGISPIQVYHAQDIRMYAQLEFFQLLNYWFFIQLLEKNKPGSRIPNAVGYVLSAALGLYTHNLAIFGLCVPALYLLIKRKWKWLWQILAANLASGLLAIPWLVRIPGQIEKIQNAFWTPKPGMIEVVQAAIMMVGSLPLPGFWLGLTAIISLQAIFLVFFLLIRKKIWNESILFLLLCGLVPPTLLFLASYLMRPVFVPRGFLASNAAFLGLAGSVIGNKNSKGIGSGLFILFLAASTISLPYQITFDQFPRSPFQSAVKFLEKRYSNQAVIVHDNKLSFFPMKFFGKTLPQRFLADEAGSPNDTLAVQTQEALGLHADQKMEDAVDERREVFFVVFKKAINEFRAEGRSDHPRIQWLELHFKNEMIFNFGDLQIYHFSQ